VRALIAAREGWKVVNLSRRRAIREKCLNCTGWIPKEVRYCEDDACPLHPYRSGKGKQDPDLRNAAIRSMCSECMVDQPEEVRLCPSKDCSLYAFRLGRIDRSTEIDSEVKTEQIAPTSGTISVGWLLPYLPAAQGLIASVM
jgi:hypothetical protein